MDKKALLMVFVSAIVSGVSIYVNSLGVKGIDSSAFTFTKNIAVAACLSCIIFGFGMARQIGKLSRAEWGKLALLGLVGGAVPFVLFFKGLQMTSGATAGFIHKLLFLFVAVIAFFVLKEKISTGWVLGGALIILGNFIMIKGELNFGIGHMLVLGATVLWAFDTVLAKHLLSEMSSMIVAWGRMFFGGIFLLLYIVFYHGTGTLGTVAGHWGWVAITSAMLLAYLLLFYHGLKGIPAHRAAAVLVLGAPVSLVLTRWMGGTMLPTMELLGVGMIVLGICSVLWLNTLLRLGHHARA